MGWGHGTQDPGLLSKLGVKENPNATKQPRQARRWALPLAAHTTRAHLYELVLLRILLHTEDLPVTPGGSEGAELHRELEQRREAFRLLQRTRKRASTLPSPGVSVGEEPAGPGLPRRGNH